MRTPQQPVRDPRIWLKAAAFKDYCDNLGAMDVRARAHELGVHRWTLRKLEDGINPVSEQVIAKALDRFRDLTFDDLFEVRLDTPAARTREPKLELLEQVAA